MEATGGGRDRGNNGTNGRMGDEEVVVVVGELTGGGVNMKATVVETTELTAGRKGEERTVHSSTLCDKTSCLLVY